MAEVVVTIPQGRRGPAGPPGRSVQTIVRTDGDGSPGTLDTYTITYSDATTSTFTVRNGTNGADGQDGQDGQDGTDATPAVLVLDDGEDVPENTPDGTLIFYREP